MLNFIFTIKSFDSVLHLHCGSNSYLAVIRVNGDLPWNVSYTLRPNARGWMESNPG